MGSPSSHFSLTIREKIIGDTKLVSQSLKFKIGKAVIRKNQVLMCERGQ